MRKAVITFLVKDQQVLLLHSFYDPSKTKIFWQGVSGFAEADEDMRTAALREIREELGITADSQTLQQKHQFSTNDIEFTVFTLEKWTGNPQPLEEGIEELRWFTVNQLPLEAMHETDKDWLPQILI